METQSVFLPSYSIGGKDVYKKVPDICRAYGTKAIVIGGEKAMAAAKEDLLAGVAGSDIEITGFLKYGDDVTYEAADALCANPDVQAADMIFAVGGGRATDTCKTASDKMNKPLFTFPTIASNCAAVTLVCVMHNLDRSLAGFHYRKEPAKHCFINLDIISKAPLEYIWAGIGDAFSKAYEPTFSSMNDDLDHSNMIGVDLAKHCGEPLFKYAVQAYDDCKNHRASEALKQIVLNIIITGGIISTLIETENTMVPFRIPFSMAAHQFLPANRITCMVKWLPMPACHSSCMNSAWTILNASSTSTVPSVCQRAWLKLTLPSAVMTTKNSSMAPCRSLHAISAIPNQPRRCGRCHPQN